MCFPGCMNCFAVFGILKNYFTRTFCNARTKCSRYIKTSIENWDFQHKTNKIVISYLESLDYVKHKFRISENGISVFNYKFVILTYTHIVSLSTKSLCTLDFIKKYFIKSYMGWSETEEKVQTMYNENLSFEKIIQNLP